MSWNIVTVDSSTSTKGVPTASIGYGRITLNKAACELLDSFSRFGYVLLLTDPDRPSVVALRFYVDAPEQGIKLRRRTANGKPISGVEIASRPHMEKIFGLVGTQKATTLYNVTVEPSEASMLVLRKR